MVDGAGGGDGAPVGCHHRQVRGAVVVGDGELRPVVLHGVRGVVGDLAVELIGVGSRGHVLDKLGTKRVEREKNKTKNQ